MKEFGRHETIKKVLLAYFSPPTAITSDRNQAKIFK